MGGEIVWLASYPKSGNTWLRAVYGSWLAKGPVDLRNLPAELVATRPVFDDALGIPSSSLTEDEIDCLRPRVDEVVARDAGGISLRKIHDAYLLGRDGEPVVSSVATRAAIYVVRDPRDVAVSYAHRVRQPPEWGWARLRDADATIAGGGDALDVQLRQRLGTWSQHVRSWLDDAPFPVLLVRYEDCVAAPAATFVAALRFAGLDVDDGAVREAVDHASFRRLRALEEEGGFDEPGAPRFFRRGEPGAWRAELPAELAAQIACDHRDVMVRLGYLLAA